MMLQRIEMPFKESVRRNNMRRQNGDTVNTETSQIALENNCNASMCIANSDMSETSTSFVVQLGRNYSDDKDAIRRYQDFEKWTLKECLNSSVLCAMKFGMRCSQLLGMCNYCHEIYLSEEMSCPSCHRTFLTCKSNLHSSEHMAHYVEKMKIATDNTYNVSPSCPLRMRLLKLLLSIVEVTTYLILLDYIL